MTQEEKTRYRKLASEMINVMNDEIQTFMTMRFDETVKENCLLHFEMIEFRESNILRLQDDRKRLLDFYLNYLCD